MSKLLAYDFLLDSGVAETADETGHLDTNNVFSVGLTVGIGRVIYAVLSLAGIAFLMLTMYGGYLWMTAQGNEEQVERAKKIIYTATIGLAITLSSFAIAWFVINAFSSQSLVQN